jgi:eukaryotic translation initiation factor 2-alpha kinase 4
MVTPPLKTGMERIHTILQLRKPEIIFPKYMEDDDENYKNEKQIIRKLLNHDPSKRPTSEELLQSEFMPPIKMEASELQEMLRNILANPQSKSYKHLIFRMMQQECNGTIYQCYHKSMLIQCSSLFDNVKSKIEEIFKKHGAKDMQMPLLTPYAKTDPESITKLMTHSGMIAALPYDLRTTFLRYVATNGVNFLRRYSIGRVYRERKHFNLHPKQIYEVEFEIVSPTRGNFLVDAELIVVAHEIISEFDVLKQKNLSFAINHSSLLRAIFLHFSVPTSKYNNLLTLINDYMEGRIKTRYQLQTSISSLLPSLKSTNNLIDILTITDTSISNISSTSLKILVRARGEASALAKGAIRELETVIHLCQAMGVTVSF